MGQHDATEEMTAKLTQHQSPISLLNTTCTEGAIRINESNAKLRNAPSPLNRPCEYLDMIIILSVESYGIREQDYTVFSVPIISLSVR